MADYLVLLHEDPIKTKDYSPTQMQALVQRYGEWIDGLRAQGRVSAAKKLMDEGGRHLRADKGKMVVSEGPYAEAKDVITGFFIMTASSYEEAQALVSGGPHYEFGWIELRAVDASVD
jgi:hypothetical protein